MNSFLAQQDGVSLYYSYHQNDRKLLEQLDHQLAVLRRQKLITTWHDGMLHPGEQTKQSSRYHLEQAKIILILLSADYIAADTCYELMELAIQRHKNMGTTVLPVLLSTISDLEALPIAELSLLPVGGRPVMRWKHRDEALASIAHGVRQVVGSFTATSHTPSSAKRIKDTPPPSQHATMLQRQQHIEQIYTQLIQPETSAIILTGMGGIGKSILAAQIYHHAEKLRLIGEGPFKQEPLWIRITPGMTVNTLRIKLSDTSDITDHPAPFLDAPTPFELAVKLLQCLQEMSKNRLIVIDQLEEWLDRRNGDILAEYVALGEWFNVLNGQPCASRILFTSRLWPQGRHIYQQMYVQEIQLQGLEKTEGVALLHLWNIQGSDSDLQRAVDRCQGHALALTLLHNVLYSRNLKLTTILDSPDYQRLWTRDIKTLIQEIYKQLTETQQNMLLAFSIYREAVSWDAAYQIMKVLHPVPISKLHAIDVSEALQGHGLLQIYTDGKERFALHPLVADFTHELWSMESEQFQKNVRREAHNEAARYYQQCIIDMHQSISQRTSIRDVQESIEYAWHLCQAGQWQKSYTFMEREHLFTDLLRWGEHTTLLELYTLLLDDQWQPQIEQSAYIQNELGDVFKRIGQKQKAQICFENALTQYRSANIPTGEVKALNNLGAIHRSNGQQEQALECYQEAIKLGQDIQASVEKGVTLNNLGRVIQSQAQDETSVTRRKKKFRQALTYYEQALVIYHTTNDLAEAAKTINNMGEVYEKLEKSAKARDCYRQAIKHCREIGERRGEGITCNNLGMLYRRLEQQQDAFEYCIQALHIFREIGDRGEEAIVLRNMGRLYIVEQQNNVALACFLQAKTIYEELHTPTAGAIPRGIQALIAGERSFNQMVIEIAPYTAQIIEKAIDEFMKR